MAGFRSNLAAALSLTMLVGCAGCAAPSTVPAPYACLLPGEQRMAVAELFFGRASLSDAEWAGFAARIITPSFPDGFTVLDGEGQWRNPRTGRIIRDPTKILLVATKRTPGLARRLSGVIDAYKARFHQQSVGVITRDTCADFD